MRSICLFYACLIFSAISIAPINVQAQLLTDKETFTRQDTLRGSLNEYRDCFDVTYYELSLKVDPVEKYISGYNRIDYRPERDFRRMQLDLFENMQINSIMYGETELKFEREGAAFFVDFPEPQEKGMIGSITVNYEGKPIIAKRAPWDGGFTWAKDEKGTDWIGVSCEGIGASLWWPNKDHLSDEPDSMLISCAVPEGLMFVGNGNLRKTHEVEEGYVRYDWFLENPINNYNVTLNIGDYVHFGESFNSTGGELMLDYYVLSYNLEKAKAQFEQVKPMMECFEQYFDPYPFIGDGYALVETPYLGMEHQSAIAYGNKYLTGYAGYDFSRIGLDFDYIIIHETGHEWWGNSISCADMADLWIHEGFCTYSEALYVECMHGYDTAILYVNAKKPTIGNEEPIIGVYGVNSEGSGDMYNKGMLILNTVRHLVKDDEIWFRAIRGITVDFRHQQVNSAQIEQYIADKTGLDLDKFWDQYLRHPKPPTLEYDINRKGKKTTISYRWKADVEGFDMPIRYRMGGEEVWINPTTEWKTLEFKKVDTEDFEFDDDSFYYLMSKVKPG